MKQVRTSDERDRTGRSGHVALYTDHLGAGGGQKLVLMLAEGLIARGYEVDLVVCRTEGERTGEVPAKVNLVELRPAGALFAKAYALASDPRLLPHVTASGTLRYLPDLVRYLRREQPDTLISARPHMNVEASLAVRLAGGTIRLIVGEQNQSSKNPALANGFRRRYLPNVLRRAYTGADAIVAASDGVADDLAEVIGVPRQQIVTIYPPVPSDVPSLAREAPGHAWFEDDGPPVVLGVGRLSAAKDFHTLIRAFARVRQQRPARLVILGNLGTQKKTDKRRAELMSLAAELGVAEDVQLPGYVHNPFSYMGHAAVFVLSSITEGFGMVVAEALACGCPVVSTDCPSGPAEILEYGQYGTLVPVRDDAALAEAILRALKSPPDTKRLRERGASFSLERFVDQHEQIMAGWSNGARG